MFITKLLNSIYNKHYLKKFKASELDLRFHPKDSIFEYGHISIGKRVFINSHAYFSAPNGEIIIGNDVLIGADVFIAAGNHNYSMVGKTINRQGYPDNHKVISIKDDVWIASKVIILGEVTINEGTVVGAGSMVLKDLPPYCLCVGNPICRPIKLRYSDDELRLHLTSLGRSSKEIEEMIQLRRKMTEGIELL